MSSVALTWALSTTVDEALQVSKGFMQAATSDNVQPIALLAAEAFGATLSVCERTRSSAVLVAKRGHTSHKVNFLKAFIGWSKGDSAHQLASSDSGARFLGLVAALSCTSGPNFAAHAIDAMIRASAPQQYIQDRMLPTIPQLQDLVSALDYKLDKTAFAESVVRWQIVLGKCAAPEQYRMADRHMRGEQIHPSVDELKALVESFRSVDRLGDGRSVEIRAYNGVPWITAFTTWCLGTEPTLLLEEGTVLIDRDSVSKVKIVLVSKSDAIESVKVLHNIEAPTVLWSAQPNHTKDQAWGGMVSIESYGGQHVIARGADSKEAQAALHQALNYSIYNVRKRLWPVRDIPALPREDPPFHPAIGDQKHYRSSLFGDDLQVGHTVRRYLNATRFQVHAPPDGVAYHSLPSVASYLKQLVATCDCFDCVETCEDISHRYVGKSRSGPNEKAEIIAILNSRCLLKYFEATVTAFTAEILALSLFDCTVPVQVYRPGTKSAWQRANSAFTVVVSQIIRSDAQQPGYCPISDILGLALSLVGHNCSKELETGEWVASSSRGQVIYPVVLDVGVLSNSGTLTLGGGPGRLLFDGVPYDSVISKKSEPVLLPPYRQATENEQVDRAQNLFQKVSVEWIVSIADRALELRFGPTASVKTNNALQILETTSRSLFVNCSHPPSTLMETPDMFSRYSTALQFDDVTNRTRYDSTVESQNWLLDHLEYKIEVIAVSGDENLRLYAMTSPFPGVVRMAACLSCCLDACRSTGLPYVVL